MRSAARIIRDQRELINDVRIGHLRRKSAPDLIHVVLNGGILDCGGSLPDLARQLGAQRGCFRILSARGNCGSKNEYDRAHCASVWNYPALMAASDS